MEIIIDGLKPNQDTYFIDEIMSYNSIYNSITHINHGKSAVIKLTMVNSTMQKLLEALNNLPSLKYYYDDDLDNFWVISKVETNKEILVDELNKVIEKNIELEEELIYKNKRIVELEQLLYQQSIERDAVIIMLKDMNKLIK